MRSQAGLYAIRRYVKSLTVVISVIKIVFLLTGLRPFGVSLLYAGYDPHYEFQLYHSDPSGNYSGWKATCIGANNGTAQSLLKQEYKDDIAMEDAISLVMRTMSKTMDSTTLGSEKRKLLPSLLLWGAKDNLIICYFFCTKVEFATLTLDPKTKTPRVKIYQPEEVDALLKKYELAKKDEDTEMRAA